LISKTVLTTILALFMAVVLSAGLALAQPLSGAPANPQYRYSTPRAPGVDTPSKVETRLGTLNFFDGFPDQATVEKCYDNLDFQRGVQPTSPRCPPTRWKPCAGALPGSAPPTRPFSSPRRSWIPSRCSSRRTTTPFTPWSGWTSKTGRWCWRCLRRCWAD